VHSNTTIAALENEEALVLDSDSGNLLRVDKSDRVLAKLSLGPNAATMAVDLQRKRAFVADRERDRVAVINFGKRGRLHHERSIATSREPYGVALSPNGKRLLVTTVADRQLHSFATRSLREEWRLDLGPEPRAVAISDDGKEATVSFLTTSAAGLISLGPNQPALRFASLSTYRAPSSENALGRIQERRRTPRKFARNAFAATYIGNTALVSYQQSTPQRGNDSRRSAGIYGGAGSDNPPALQRLAFIPRGAFATGRAHIRANLPRALTYDRGRDRLYLVDLGSDEVITVEGASGALIRGSNRTSVANESGACGPSGIAVTPSGKLLVYCSFSRTIARITPAPSDANAGTDAFSKPLTASRLSKNESRGRELFHKINDPRLSSRGALACANCHPEGRTDGLTWSIEGNVLQTPLLAGRVAGAHPFKWDGQDKTLQSSLLNTVKRLGGSGINRADAKAIAAYLKSLPAPRAPQRDATRVAKGREIFHGKTAGCARCHSGPLLSDQRLYDFGGELEKVNTPSLVGLASSAPYYHDGSAATLRALLLENGSVHGMGSTGKLGPGDLDNLIAYLEAL
jgi:DNA-binding beta-propeller fold protein YncE